MRKSFTLVELIIVLVILGILATIAVEILLKVYQNYVFSKATNELVYKTDLVLNTIASKLENRVDNSVIATECNVTNNDCIKGIIKGFDSLQNINEDEASKYPVIEWLSKDIYSKRGEWNGSQIVPGWSGFVDLNKTKKFANDDYNISIPYSNLNIIQQIDGNFSKSWGIEGYEDVFDNNLSVIIFSGADGRGAFNDINHSYGWYKSLYPTNKAQKVFAIIDKNETANIIRVKTIDDTNDTTVYEGFFIINTAMAIVPSYDKDNNDFNLTFIQNYYPWRDQNFTDGNKSLLAEHVIEFKFRKQNGLLRLYLCIQNPNVNINENEKLTVCKEKVVF